MDNNELINRKTSRISSNQTFILLILLLLSYASYSIYTKRQISVIEKNRYDLTSKKSDKIINLLTLMVDSRINVVNAEGAKHIYQKTFKASACNILDKAMYTLSVNHVHDSSRQVQITKYYYRAIENMYMDDKQILSDYKYKNKRLDGIMDSIDPNEVTKTVLSIMFSNIETTQKRLDIREYLYSTFNKFYNKAQEYIGNGE